MTEFVTGRSTTVDQLLWLLNGRQPVDLKRISFAVITGIYTPYQDEPTEWPFQRGEVIPVSCAPAHWDGSTYVEDGPEREISGQGRNFGPWDMHRVVFSTRDVQEAIEVAQFAADGKDGVYEHFDGHWRMRSDQDEAYREWCSNLEALRIADHSWE
jgi:hypothetical protein